MKKKYVILIIVAAVIIIGGVITLLLLNKKENVKLYPIQVEEKWGYIDKEGKLQINPQFQSADAFREGLALVSIKKGVDNKDNSNVEVATETPVEQADEYEGDYYSVTRTETPVEYAEDNNYNNDVEEVQTNTVDNTPKYGFIKEDGSYAINPIYMAATSFSEGLAWVVTKGGVPTAIDKKGKIQITLKNAKQVRVFHEGLAAFCSINANGEQKWGFINKSGEIVINPQFNYVSSFSNGLCAVGNDKDKYGYINKDGKIVVNYQFDAVSDYKPISIKQFLFIKTTKYFATVRTSDKWGAIDKDGKYTINPQFQDLSIDTKAGMFLVKMNDKYGWCDEKGKMKINPQFDNAQFFGNYGLAPVLIGEKWGYIDKEGKVQINQQFDIALPFFDDIAFISAGEKLGAIDKTGKYTINPQFNGMSVDFLYFNYGMMLEDNVSSDYFDINIVNSLLNLKGINLNRTFNQIMSEYKLNKDNFSEYSSDNLIKDVEIVSGVDYKMYIEGSAYDTYSDYDPYWGFSYNTTRTFNPNKKITGMAFVLSFSGDRLKAKNNLFNSMQIPAGYKLFKQEKDLKAYKNNVYAVVVKRDKYQITIVVLPKDYL
jgi:hypothetical protein